MGLSYNQITENVITTAPKNINDITSMDSLETVSLTCINLSEELIVIDCGAVSKKAKDFRKAMERHFEKNVSHLLLTHSHWDHSDALDVFQDTTVVISRRGANKIYFKPDILVPERLTLGCKGNEVLFQVTGGHSNDSAYIYSPSEQVLCAGDNLLTCYSQVFINGKVLLDVYRDWESLNVQSIIPGHGYVVKKGYLSNVKEYFEDLISIVTKLKSQGFSISRVLKSSSLPEYCYKNHPKWEGVSRRHTGWLILGIKYWYRNL